MNLVESYIANAKTTKYKQFAAFVESLKRPNNTSIIESIVAGIKILIEAAKGEWGKEWGHGGKARKQLDAHNQKLAEKLKPIAAKLGMKIAPSGNEMLKDMYDVIKESGIKFPENELISLFYPPLIDSALEVRGGASRDADAEELMTKALEYKIDRALDYDSALSGLYNYVKRFMTVSATTDTTASKRAKAGITVLSHPAVGKFIGYPVIDPKTGEPNWNQVDLESGTGQITAQLNNGWRVKWGAGKFAESTNISDAELNDEYVVFEYGQSVDLGMTKKTNDKDEEKDQESGHADKGSASNAGVIGNLLEKEIDQLESDPEIKKLFPEGMPKDVKDFIMEFALFKQKQSLPGTVRTAKAKASTALAKSIAEAKGISEEQANKIVPKLLAERKAIQDKISQLRLETSQQSKATGRGKADEIKKIGYENPTIKAMIDKLRSELAGLKYMNEKGDVVSPRGILDKEAGETIDTSIPGFEYGDGDMGLRLLDQLYFRNLKAADIAGSEFGTTAEVLDKYNVNENTAEMLLKKFMNQVRNSKIIMNAFGKTSEAEDKIGSLKGQALKRMRGRDYTKEMTPEMQAELARMTANA